MTSSSSYPIKVNNLDMENKHGNLNVVKFLKWYNNAHVELAMNCRTVWIQNFWLHIIKECSVIWSYPYSQAMM